MKNSEGLEKISARIGLGSFLLLSYNCYKEEESIIFINTCFRYDVVYDM